jgi:hypothetical protein
VVVWAVGAAVVVVGRVDAILVDAVLDEVLEEDFDVLRFLVLKGLAIGARLIVPSALVEGVGEGCFVFVAAVSIALDTTPAETARSRSAVARHRNNIYCTLIGLTSLFDWAEASEMTGAGSFGWGPG